MVGGNSPVFQPCDRFRRDGGIVSVPLYSLERLRPFLAAHAAYRELHYDIHYWRTRSGLEVDFILGAGEVAVEVKGSAHVRDRELLPLRAFVQEHRPQAALVVSTEPAERAVGGIRIVPWKSFLSRLWAGEIIA